MENKSPKFQLNGTDFWKVLRGTLIMLVAAGLYGVISFVAEQYQTWEYVVCVAEFPCVDTAFLAIPAISGLLELGRRFLSGLRNEE